MNNIEFFDEMAPKWDAMCEVDDRKIKHILDVAEVKPGDEVLDVGTGTGVLVPFLVDRIARGRIVAVDLSSGMLREARRKYGDCDNVEFRHLDVETDLIREKFDHVMMYCMFPHLEDGIETVNWLVRVNLRPEGTLVIAHPESRHAINEVHHRHSPDGTDELGSIGELVDRLKEQGLNVDYEEDNDEYYIVRIRA